MAKRTLRYVATVDTNADLNSGNVAPLDIKTAITDAINAITTAGGTGAVSLTVSSGSDEVWPVGKA
jgi:hypothetical protein